MKSFPNLEAALKGVFNRVLTSLDLAGSPFTSASSGIGDDGAKAIAEALKVNAVVTKLWLNNNKIGDDGAKAIAEALKVNAVLNFFLNASENAQEDALSARLCFPSVF